MCSQWFRMSHVVFVGYFGYDNSIYNRTPQFKNKYTSISSPNDVMIPRIHIYNSLGKT